MQTEMLLGFPEASFGWALLNDFHPCICFPASNIPLMSLVLQLCGVMPLSFNPIIFLLVGFGKSRGFGKSI